MASFPLRRRWPLRVGAGVLRRVGDLLASWIDAPAIARPRSYAEPWNSGGSLAPAPAVIVRATPWPPHVHAHADKWLGRVRGHEPLDAPERTRRLRVAARRLRAMMLVLHAPELPEPPGDRGLRKLGRRLGTLRDLDLALEHTAAARALAEEAIDRVALEELEGWLAQRREHALTRALAARATTTLAHELVVIERSIEAIADDEPRARAVAESALTRLAGELAAAIDAGLADDELERLHALRITARRLRYAAELFEPCLLPLHREWLARARDVQRAIGSHRDAAAWHELVAARVARASARGRITLARGLASTLRSAEAGRERELVAIAPALLLLRGALVVP